MGLSNILKMSRGVFLPALMALVLLSQTAEAKFPLNVFKGVSDCLSHNKKYLSPTLGMAALDGGVMGNIRFYGNFEAAWHQTKDGSERDYANDHSRDPVWQLVRILFPSTAGQLSADSAHQYNFGKHVKNPKTVALLINFADDVRSGKDVDEEALQNDLLASMGYVFKEKMTEGEKVKKAYALLNQDKLLINHLLLEAHLAVEVYGNKIIEDQRNIGEVKNNLLRILTKYTKKIRNGQIKILFMDKIRKLYSLSSYTKPKYQPDRKPLPVKSEFFHYVLGEINQAKIAAEQILNHTTRKDLLDHIEKRQPKQKFLMAFKKETITPLLKTIKNAILDEKPEGDAFYPKYTPEQIILAFLAYKFSSRQDIKVFLTHLRPDMVNPEAVAALDSSDLLTTEDLPPLADKENLNADDILALATADIFAMPTPYRVGTPILSNGNTKKYDRKSDSFIPGTFADCVEISIRHLINCFLYNPTTKQFDFTGLKKHHASHLLRNEQKAIFAAFENFYKIQSVDLSNDGSMEMRSQWNRVVGDLNSSHEPLTTKIRYRQQTNELDAGFINLMKILQKVLNIPIKPAPAPKASLDDKKKWLEEAFKEVFNVLNPHEGYSIRFNMDKVIEKGSEISGIVTISVYDQQSILYSFDFRSDPDRHGELDHYRVSDRLKAENYVSALKGHSFKGRGAENVIWLLAKDPQLRASKNLPPFYQWFGDNLSDNEARLRALQRMTSLTPDSLTDHHHKLLIHLLDNLSWDDLETVNTATPFILDLVPLFPEGMENHVKGLRITDQLEPDVISNLRFFPHLEFLNASRTKKITQLPLAGLTQLKTLNIYNSAIESLPGLEGCTALETLNALRAQKLPQLPLHGLTQLKMLIISYSTIESLPGLEGCTALETLNAIGNQKLPQLPLHGLTQLKTLDISDSAIASLPGLEKCSALETLNVIGNQKLPQLPLHGLTQLKTLDISDSAIASLPGLEQLSPPPRVYR